MRPANLTQTPSSLADYRAISNHVPRLTTFQERQILICSHAARRCVEIGDPNGARLHAKHAATYAKIFANID